MEANNQQEKKVVAAPQLPAKDISKEDVKNPLADFINSDNTDIDKEENEAKLNDDLDSDEDKLDSQDIPEKLKDLPRKYWKHQTV